MAAEAAAAKTMSNPISIPMVLGMLSPFSARNVFIRQNLTSVDVRF